MHLLCEVVVAMAVVAVKAISPCVRRCLCSRWSCRGDKRLWLVLVSSWFHRCGARRRAWPGMIRSY